VGLVNEMGLGNAIGLGVDEFVSLENPLVRVRGISDCKNVDGCETEETEVPGVRRNERHRGHHGRERKSRSGTGS